MMAETLSLYFTFLYPVTQSSVVG